MQDSSISLAADIVAAYVSNNPLKQADLPKVLADVHASLARMARGEPVDATDARPVPAVPVKKSVTADFIFCLEDGKPFKSLKRHLSTAFNMTPEEYRAKWGLPPDYPMVAPNYAQTRSTLAKRMRLGVVEEAAE
ncbi:putative transcriptional regulator [Labrys monachus]|uniref:Transcriptional regulator n=1 Tax=Labrys monachus TaxID=217067 RepID=A0ABU0F6U7_9HYPH|nr:MucR family transcriptional regulator [Labrys monachus]MDQ0390338.1 putative transcriptional regulator [Labrys monachus]